MCVPCLLYIPHTYAHMFEVIHWQMATRYIISQEMYVQHMCIFIFDEVNTLAQVNDTMHCKFHTGVSSASLFHSEHILSVTISLT